MTYDLVQYGEFFITEASDEVGKVWTWDAGGFGNWVRPPGAQKIDDLDDASTSPLGNNNLFLGERSGSSASGTNNVGVGFASLSNVTSGNANVAVGQSAGSGIEDGTGNVFIGNSAGSSLSGSTSN